MTGLETFDALRTATQASPFGSAFDVNPVNFCDLCKLTPEMLISRGFAEKYAERVSWSLFNGDVTLLGRYLGLVLRERRWAPRLSPH